MDRKKKVWFARIKGTVFALGLALFILGVGIPADNGHARGMVKPEVRLPDGYPDGFDGYGLLNRITPAEVVIGDHLHRLALHVEYNTYRERNTTPALFVPGRLVGYLLNPQGQIMSLWMIE